MSSERSADGPTTVWVAVGASGDDMNDPHGEIVGVFTTEEKAITAARAVFPRTGGANPYELDVPFLDEGDR